MLTLRLPLEDGVYRISATGGRTFGISADGGRNFARIDARGVVAGRVEVRGGGRELKLANCYDEANPATYGLGYVDRVTAERLDESVYRILKLKSDCALTNAPAAEPDTESVNRQTAELRQWLQG